jgi:hypothetical protein
MRIHPGVQGAVVRTSGEVYVENGERHMGLNITVTDQTLDEWKQGYRCAAPPHGCLAAQREAFPEKCIEPYCNFNLKRDLASWLEFAYRGEVNLWPDQDEHPDIWLPDR